MAGNSVDNEEPDRDGGGADETGDDALTQKIVRPLGHRSPLVQWDATFPKIIPNTWIYSKRSCVRGDGCRVVVTWHRSRHAMAVRSIYWFAYRSPMSDNVLP